MMDSPAAGDTPDATHATASSHHTSIARQLREECAAMAQYALANGMPVAPKYLESLNTLLEHGPDAAHAHAIAELGSIHQELTRVVAPATPRTIVLLGTDTGHRLHFLGPVPLIRQLSLLAIAFLVGLLGVSLSGEVNIENLNRGLLQASADTLFVNEIFLLCAAGLGASFAALFKANTYIGDATYDPRFDSSYWSQIILGVIAGIILVELLPASTFAQSDFGKPSLAMFGGFSANVVNRLLVRLVETLETLVKGPTSATANTAALNAQVEEQRTRVNAGVAAELIELSHGLDHGDGKAATAEINKLVKRLLGSNPG